MIGEKIRELRKERKLSLTELALRADCAKSYLSDIERGTRDNPSIHFLEKIADVLGVPMEYFLDTVARSPHATIRIHPSQQKFINGVQALDWEWLSLVREASESGVSKEQFREFIDFAKWKQTGDK